MSTDNAILAIGCDLENTLAFKRVQLAEAAQSVFSLLGLPFELESWKTYMRTTFGSVWGSDWYQVVNAEMFALNRTISDLFESGLTRSDLIRGYFRYLGSTAQVTEESVALIQAEYNFEWLDGARETLIELDSRGYEVGILTNLDGFASFAAQDLLRTFNLDYHLSLPLYTSPKIRTKKPQLAAFASLLNGMSRRCGRELMPRQLVYIGDGGSLEIQAAGSGDPGSEWPIIHWGVGMTTILIAGQNGYAHHHPEDTLERFATHVVQRIGDILQLDCLSRPPA